MFRDKVILITGGTGSFGNAVIERFLKTEIGEIRVFSRDEKKQEDMRLHLRDKRVQASSSATCAIIRASAAR